MNLLEMREQMVHWMNDMKHGYRDSDMYMEVDCFSSHIRMLIYTLTNKYQIVAICHRTEMGLGKFVKTYLGAVASSRTPRAGEDWTRGNDLADGEFCKETWVRILSDIVGYELVKIHRPIQHKFDCREEEKWIDEDKNEKY